MFYVFLVTLLGLVATNKAFLRHKFGLEYDRLCNVSQYGAIGDNKTDNTNFIQSAIEDCSSNNTNSNGIPNMILLATQIPYSSNNIETVYISGSLFFESNLIFYISNNVRLLGTSNKSNISYPQIYTRAAGTMGYQHAALINGGICKKINYNNTIIGDQCESWHKLSNITISGNGIIDGNGHSGWYNPPYGNNNRPCLLNLMWINNLIIKNITLTNSPFWTLHPLFSNNILIENITILTDGPNTDGIDPDSCKNVIIRNNYISTGDDCIAIKSGKNKDGRKVNISSDNILIENCEFGSGHGISIGSEMSGNVTNIIFKNLNLESTGRGPRIKSCLGRGGMVSNITYQNIFVKNVDTGISLDEYYGSNSCGDDSNQPPIFKDILIQNLTGSVTGDAGDFQCLKEMPCTNIILKNVDITSYKNGFQCQYAYGNSTNVKPDSCLK